MDAREQRGMQIAATTRLRRTTEGWIVPSQSGGTSYRVRPLVPLRRALPGQTIPDYTCTCPDWEARGRDCKHVFAVEFTMRREVVSDGMVMTEEVKVTYSQEWASYNRAQCQEKETFLPMLADLCSTLPSPQQSLGRPRMPLSDMAFACVYRVYEGLSARRFDSDVRESQAKGLTEADPHFNTVLRHLRSPEMTPGPAEPGGVVRPAAAGRRAGFRHRLHRVLHLPLCERWYDSKCGNERTRQSWVKLHAMSGVRTNIVTAVEISGGHGNDSPYLVPTLATTAQNFTIREVSADKAYSS